MGFFSRKKDDEDEESDEDEEEEVEYSVSIYTTESSNEFNVEGLTAEQQTTLRQELETAIATKSTLNLEKYGENAVFNGNYITWYNWDDNGEEDEDEE
jgi:hypothetical protein